MCAHGKGTVGIRHSPTTPNRPCPRPASLEPVHTMMQVSGHEEARIGCRRPPGGIDDVPLSANEQAEAWSNKADFAARELFASYLSDARAASRLKSSLLRNARCTMMRRVLLTCGGLSRRLLFDPLQGLHVSLHLVLVVQGAFEKLEDERVEGAVGRE